MKSLLLAGLMCSVAANSWAAKVPQRDDGMSLKRLDEAKTSKARRAAEDEIVVTDAKSESEVRAYVNDKKKDGRKRLKALRALHKSQSEDVRAKDLTKYFAEKSDDNFRAGVAMEMGRVKRPELAKRLRGALDDAQEGSQVQLSAAWSLAASGDGYGKTRALKAVLEADPWRDFGMQTLVILKAKDVLPKIDSCLSEQKKDAILNSCRLAKLRIELSDQDHPTQLNSLDAALREDKYFDVRAWAGRRLADDGDKAAGKILASVARDNKLPGSLAALDGLKIGVSKGRWTRQEVEGWLKK